MPSIFLSITIGKIRIVFLLAFLRRIEPDTFYVFQVMDIPFRHALPLCNLLLDETQIAKPHHRTELVHLRLCTNASFLIHHSKGMGSIVDHLQSVPDNRMCCRSEGKRRYSIHLRRDIFYCLRQVFHVPYVISLIHRNR